MPSPNLPKPQKYTFKDFDGEFPDDAACLRWLVGFLYPYGIHCLKCSEVLPHHQLANRPKVWSCGRCGTHTHPTAGTIFHKSSTSLRTWFHAIFLMSATRCGISAMQLMRETGVTYKTAWRMFNQIRRMLNEDIRDLGGDRIVEADETWIGPRVSKMNRARRKKPAGKVAIGGLMERGGRVAAYPLLPAKNWASVSGQLRQRVKRGSTIYTDEAKFYDTLGATGYIHRTVNHSLGEYVDWIISTNGIEGFWGNTKRGISGVYHHVSVKHLQGYLNEYTFRLNHKGDQQPMFKVFCDRISDDFVSENFPEKYRPRQVLVG